MIRTMARLMLVSLMAASPISLFATEKRVAGNWTFSAEGYVMKMVLVQSGKKITGRLESPHGPWPVKGEFAKGRITFSGGGPDGVGGRMEVAVTGVLQADGRLAGTLTGTAGNMTWTAVRE